MTGFWKRFTRKDSGGKPTDDAAARPATSSTVDVASGAEHSSRPVDGGEKNVEVSLEYYGGAGESREGKESLPERAADVVAAAGGGGLTETADHDRAVATGQDDGQRDGTVPAAEQDDESKYPTGTKLALLTFGLCMATFVVALDNTIIATAIPRITTQFDSLDDVGWYGSAYLLTTTSLQPSFGKVYTYFDVKWVYLSALVIFEVGSILCATAVNSTMLIVGRAVAGAGAAAMFSGAMTIIGYTVPLRKRAIFIAALSSMFGISSIIGPILGGVLTDRSTWRWCFWINLPFGGVTILTVLFFFSNPPRRYGALTTKEKLAKIDLRGAVLLIGAIVCLLLALQWGGSTYPWSDARVWGCILGFGLIILCFVALQIYLGDRATFPPRILCRQRTVAACAAFSSLLAAALYTHIYYLPFYFQAVKGTSAEGSGIRCIPYLISNTLASIVVGAAITVLGPYNPPMWLGSAIFCVGSGLLYTLGVNAPTGMWIGYEIVAGIGAGACVQIPFIAVQVVLSEEDMPVGNAVAIFFNTLGGAISVSVAQNIFTNTLLREVPRRAPQVDPRAVIQAGATGLRAAVPASLLPGVLEAYDLAVTDAFILPIAVSGLAFVVSFLVEWKSVKGKNLMAGGGG